MKKIIKTNYYDTFRCIADKCSLTCCQEWNITVDDKTYKKWDQLSLTKENGNTLQQYVKEKDDTHVIALNEQKQCPFLNKQKLCGLVLNFGDEVLSNTCATFPRQIQEFKDRTEYSLASCCPEAVDFINKQDTISFTDAISDKDSDIFLRIRTMLITIMENHNFTTTKSILMIFYILLDIHEKESFTEKESDDYKNESFLKELSETIDQMNFNILDTMEENNELFLDIAENYRKQGIYTKYLEPLASLAEDLSDDYDKNDMKLKLKDFEIKFASYENLFRNYLVVELYSNLIMPESDIESMLVMFQWIAMEYAIIKHSIFLGYLLDFQNQLSYDGIRNYIVIISRMMGYDYEDICEYLANNFKSITWEWGYLALLIGAE